MLPIIAFRFVRNWLQTINALCQKEKKYYISIVPIIKMLTAKHELKNLYLRSYIQSVSINKHTIFDTESDLLHLMQQLEDMLFLLFDSLLGFWFFYSEFNFLVLSVLLVTRSCDNGLLRLKLFFPTLYTKPSITACWSRQNPISKKDDHKMQCPALAV